MSRQPFKPLSLNLKLKVTTLTSKTRPSMSCPGEMAANPIDQSPTFGLNSPMTNLAMNLSELSTRRGTPKRRLSLSSIDTPPSDDCRSSFDKASTSSTESGVFVDSPTLLDSPTLESYAQRYRPNFPLEAFTKKRTIAFRRIDSQPPPTLHLDCDSPTEFLDSMDTDDQCHSAPLPSTSSSTSCSDAATCKLNFFVEEGSSQDSGLGLEKDLGFKIPAGAGLRRRKQRLNEISEETCSPHKYSPIKSPQKRSLSFCLGSFRNANTDGDSPIRLKRSSLTCNEGDDDDGFLDLVDQEVAELTDNVPSGLSSLFTEPVISKPCSSKDESTPTSRRILPAKRFLKRSQSIDVGSRQFKRAEPPELFEGQSKRWKSEQTHDDSCTTNTHKVHPRRLQRCHSETEAMIKSAVQRLTEEADLIADSSKPCVLPTMRGKHQDLKAITPETLSHLLSGDFADQVEEYHVIDCRYPYEFKGGHIQDALNIFSRDTLVEQYLKNPRTTTDPNKRFLLIFHCEFSSERAPSLYRFLRKCDRESNKECYPVLHYPEIYLLEGGYKAFFEKHKPQCEPQTYRHMLHKDFSDDLRHFRAKSKSWSGEKGGRTGLRALKF
ncbi:M-phase inducer phosphatase-like isoform X2 [Littorina saxatilis]